MCICSTNYTTFFKNLVNLTFTNSNVESLNSSNLLISGQNPKLLPVEMKTTCSNPFCVAVRCLGIKFTCSIKRQNENFWGSCSIFVPLSLSFSINVPFMNSVFDLRYKMTKMRLFLPVSFFNAAGNDTRYNQAPGTLG